LSGPIVASAKQSAGSAGASSPDFVRSPTPASWGGTQRESLFVQPRRRIGLIAGLAGLGVVVIAGLAFGLHSLLSFSADQPTNSSQPSAVASAPPPPAAKKPVAEPAEPPPSPVLDLKEFAGPPDAGGFPEPEPPRSFPRPSRPIVQHARPSSGSGAQPRPQPEARPADKPSSGKPADLLGY
jgi:hypothetical protein